MSIHIKLTGFDDILKQIEEAGGSVESATESCIKESADIMRTELLASMRSSEPNLDPGLANRLPENQIEIDGNIYSARVGYKSTNYDPNNPSDYFKAIFANYGTPADRTTSRNGKRVMIDGKWVTLRATRGRETARGFIQRAKEAARPKIKKQQSKALNDILSGLKG